MVKQARVETRRPVQQVRQIPRSNTRRKAEKRSKNNEETRTTWEKDGTKAHKV